LFVNPHVDAPPSPSRDNIIGKPVDPRTPKKPPRKKVKMLDQKCCKALDFEHYEDGGWWVGKMFEDGIISFPDPEYNSDPDSKIAGEDQDLA